MCSLEETEFLAEAYIMSLGKKELVCSGNNKEIFGFNTQYWDAMK